MFSAQLMPVILLYEQNFTLWSHNNEKYVTCAVHTVQGGNMELHINQSYCSFNQLHTSLFHAIPL